MKLKCLVLAAALLTACGDDSSSGIDTENVSGTQSVESSSSIIDSHQKETSSSSVYEKSDYVSSSAEESVESSSSEVESSSSIEASFSSNSQSFPANYDAALNSVTDERDGKKYKTVTIGSQTWFAENLAYEITDMTYHEEPEYRCPDDKEENCEKYGYLYPWLWIIDPVDLIVYQPAVPDSVRPFKGICPTGWHLPSVDEWQILIDNVNYEDLLAESAGGTGKSGFDVFFTGGLSFPEGAYEFGEKANFVTVDESSSGYVAVSFSSTYVASYVALRKAFISVRCLMD
jgi:uncharacterized protein (TIGR02145 family)